MAPFAAQRWRRDGSLAVIPSGKGDTTLFPKLNVFTAASRPARAVILLAAILAVMATGGCTAGSLFSTTVWAAPVFIDDETVVVGTQTGHIVVGNIVTGQELGRCETGEGRNSVRAIYGTPLLLDDGRVIAGGFDGVLYAVNPNALLPDSEAACTPFFEADSAIVGGAVLTPDGALLIGTEGGTLYALDAENAAVRWTFTSDGEIWGTPVLGDGHAYVGTLKGVLHAVTIGSAGGSEVWRHTAEAGIGGMTLSDDGTLYVGAFDRNMYALDAETGQSRWASPFTAQNWFWAAPLIVGDRLFAPSLDHSLYILDTDTGVPVTDPLMTGGAIRSEPAVVGDRIIIANEEKETWWIDPETGAGIVGGKLPEPMYAPIVTIDDTDALFFAQDGVIYRASPSLRQPVRVFPLEN